MAHIRFANNVSTRLTEPVAADDSTITVRSLSDGLIWPDISATGDYFLIVIDDISMVTWEILKCTKVEINGNATTLTVERGIEGTTPSRFNAGSVVENRLTAGTLDMFSDKFPAVVEIDRGGTGAITVEEARTNLEVPSKTEVDNDISSLDTKLTNAINTKAPIYHAAADTTYGLGTDALYGHVKGDNVTTNIQDGKIVVKDVAIKGNTTDCASKRGQIGNRATLSGIDYNTLIKYGHYIVEGRGSTNTPTGNEATFYVDVYETTYSAVSVTRILQIAYRYNTAHQFVRASQNGGVTWTPWEKSIYTSDLATASTPGIMRPGDGLIVGSEGAINLDDTVVRTTGSQTINGQKTNTSQFGWIIKRDAIERGNPGTTSTGGTYTLRDKNNKSIGSIDLWFDKGNTFATIYAMNGMDATDTSRASIAVHFKNDGTKYATCPTPSAAANSNAIATTEWVRDYAPTASSSAVGLVKPGTGTSVAGDGTLNVDTASTSKKGIVQLSSSVASTSETIAATSKAVKTAYDKAVAAFNATDIVGEYKIAHTTSISGYLLCNGAAVSRTTYADLFAKLGTKFGIGDGSTTFNLPDFRNKTFWGAKDNLGDKLEAGLPNATGKVDIIASTGGWDCPHYDGALFPASYYESPWFTSSGSGMMQHSVQMDLSKSNTIYGNADTVQPPAIAVNVFIKY